MLLHRLEFELTLVVKAPLTLGTGLMTPAGTAEEPRNLVEIHKDKAENAYIPATSLKGALRAVYDGADKDAIFGKIKSEKTGNMGRLLLYAATTLNHKEELRHTTAINRKTGTAEKGKLFTLKAVETGVEFTLKGLLMLGEMQENPAQRLAQIFAPLHAGLALGKGSKHGLGRVEVKEIKAITLQEVNKNTLLFAISDMKAAYETALKARNAPTFTKAVAFTLACEGAYLSIGENKPTDKGNHIKVLKKDEKPVLLPTSLYGAMRARAAWLFALAELRRIGPPRKENDRRFNYHLEKPEEITSFTPIERLFGVSGFKGLLQIETIACINPGSKRDTTHIAIDRFTGGSMDGALFDIEAVQDCAFQVTLSYSRRMAKNVNANEDKAFLAKLIQDLQENGLMLGYGAAKGYGWFKLENVQW